jgi:hypothetical protein
VLLDTDRTDTVAVKGLVQADVRSWGSYNQKVFDFGRVPISTYTQRITLKCEADYEVSTGNTVHHSLEFRMYRHDGYNKVAPGWWNGP